MKINIVYSLLALLVIFSSCDDGDDGAPATGTLSGTITDGADGTGLLDASIIVFNSDTNTPINTVVSDADGNYAVNLEPGTYFTKVTKQGYFSVPAQGVSGIPFTIEAGVTITQDITLFESNDNNLGLISGEVTSGGTGIGGVLIVAQGGGEAYSSVSNSEGVYKMFNVGTGNYLVEGFIAGYNSGNASATVALDIETENVDIELNEGAGGSLTGQLQFLATENAEVDVALVHPKTKETIPGLSTFTNGGAYILSNIPDGTYIARATFANDNLVMDPNNIFKFGEPQVSIVGTAEEQDFAVTGSVELIAPTNTLSSVTPFETTDTAPVFNWVAYPSTSDYVIEVTDATTGEVIWGGIQQDGTASVKNIEIPSSQTSIQYNEDGNATVAALEVGKVYRWRIMASKDAQAAPGWNLISASEDQVGLIKIVE
ncbi:carboxypeptidase-like regulatory domain-containing protein [Fulvivirga lutea]|nr:carboxypeptidase-like regulatory domain-containing protein [Fulvivirga lutea]